jgi:thioredoxin-related protein
MKFSFYILALFLLSYALPTQAQIEWLSIEQLEQRMTDAPRKVLVKIYTENCNWCKRMDEETFEQAYVAEYVGEYYYAVALDANTQDEITFKGESYKYSKSGKIGRHELAVELTKGNLSYPSVVFLDDQLNVLQSVSGYKPYPLFQQIMTYYGKDFHTRIPWSSYQSTYVPKKDEND